MGFKTKAIIWLVIEIVLLFLLFPSAARINAGEINMGELIVLGLLSVWTLIGLVFSSYLISPYKPTAEDVRRHETRQRELERISEEAEADEEGRIRARRRR